MLTLAQGILMKQPFVHYGNGPKPLGTFAAVVILLFIPLAVQAGESVAYSNDFESKRGTTFPEWSSSRIVFVSRADPSRGGTLPAPIVTNVESPRGGRRFLGEFGGPRIDPTARTRVRQAIRLTLNDLAPHTEATLSFDLLVLKSWDGTSPQYGPDRFRVHVVGGPVLFDSALSNNPKLESDRSFQDYPRAASQPRTGATSAKTLGYGFFGDSVYALSFTFPHTADSLVIEFASDLFEGKGTDDESWGLDDVTVRIADRVHVAPPIPGRPKSIRKPGRRPAP
jgi:hypothetical protein